ncbi:permease-like cell division protein FtsX [Nonomuraea sp. SYSU D8015]|uniref:permease-like cell division protein FtsX n=1 Tax=Nonomuraea sp. SYSU D8015 TaxID=2593644 RepID=UPI0016613912|nr:permease-like cell division protein FtsX [Nonomuraea sp. SYSU D8015]
MNRVVKDGGVPKAGVRSRRPWLWSGTAACVVGLSASVVVAGPDPAVAATAPPVSAAESRADDEREIVVFLCTPASYGCRKRAATEKQKQALHTYLEAMPESAGVQFLDRTAMYKNFRRYFAANRPLLKAVKAKDLPESFHLRVKQGTDRDKVVVALLDRPGVGAVEDLAEVYGDLSPMWSDWDASIFLCVAGSEMPACTSGRGRASKKAATFREKKPIVATLDGDPAVMSYVFEDQKTAYRNFVEDQSHNKELVAAVKVTDMPESYRLTLRHEADWNTVTGRLARMPGVGQVHNRRCSETKVKLVAEYGFSDVPGTGALERKACRPGAG